MTIYEIIFLTFSNLIFFGLGFYIAYKIRREEDVFPVRKKPIRTTLEFIPEEFSVIEPDEIAIDLEEQREGEFKKDEAIEEFVKDAR